MHFNQLLTGCTQDSYCICITLKVGCHAEHGTTRCVSVAISPNQHDVSLLAAKDADTVSHYPLTRDDLLEHAKKSVIDHAYKATCRRSTLTVCMTPSLHADLSDTTRVPLCANLSRNT